MRGSVAMLVLGLSTVPARADGRNDETFAIALYAQGRELVAAGDYAHACEKFEAAHAHTAWLGIELNLADCYEHVGRTASAWMLFRKAADAATHAHDRRAAYARARATKLEPAVPYLVVRSAATARITVDGTRIAMTELGTPLPLDPGTHVVSASEENRVPWSSEVMIAAGDHREVEVPTLALVETVEARAVVVAPVPVPYESTHSMEPPAVRARLDHNRLAPGLLAGGGGLALGAALFVGLDAKARYDDAVATHCFPTLACDQRGAAAIHGAHLRADLATGLGVAGMAALGTALFVYLRSPITPIVLPGGGGVGLSGAL